MFILAWQETGEPTSIAPTVTGYGRKIIESKMLRVGKYQVEYAASGLKFWMEVPLEKIGWDHRVSDKLKA